jgi:hypothetical protein
MGRDQHNSAPFWINESKQGETMTTKFTPGPWPIKRDGNTVISIGKIGANEYAGEAWLDISCADACLVEAAPDLYAVLSELEESCEYWSEYDVPLGMVDRIKSALKRARGEE